MIYKNTFNLTGTLVQQSIVKEAMDKIKFPWERLKMPNAPTEIGWRDLNNGSYNTVPAKKHEGLHPGDDVLTGSIDGKKYIMGIFYTYTGRIFLDNGLVQYPSAAQSTVSAEIAHAVDYFLPLTDPMREQISVLMHGGNAADHGHSWWEKYDYSAEYFSLVGEAFMQAFTVAYSDIEFDTYGWGHSITKDQAPALRKIIGIERTDYVAPAPAPIPEPVKELPKYEVFGTSKIYHAADKHYPLKVGKYITDITGYTPCKYCLSKKLI